MCVCVCVEGCVLIFLFFWNCSDSVVSFFFSGIVPTVWHYSSIHYIAYYIILIMYAYAYANVI